MIIFGGRRTVKPLGILQAQCPRCGQVAAQRLIRTTRWFTLFFLPVIPLGSRHIATCTYCGSAVVVPKEAVDGLLAGQAGPPPLPPPMQAIPPPGPAPMQQWPQQAPPGPWAPPTPPPAQAWPQQAPPGPSAPPPPPPPWAPQQPPGPPPAPG